MEYGNFVVTPFVKQLRNRYSDISVFIVAAVLAFVQLPLVHISPPYSSAKQ